MEIAQQAEQRNNRKVPLLRSVLVTARYHENLRDTHMILEVAMWKKRVGGRMIGQHRLAETSLGVEKQFALVKVTALGVERLVLDEPILAVRHLVDYLSPQALRRNKQLQRDLCHPGRSIAPTLERLDLRTWCADRTRTVDRTALVRFDFAPEVGLPE